jgi:hypothetical protein
MCEKVYARVDALLWPSTSVLTMHAKAQFHELRRGQYAFANNGKGVGASANANNCIRLVLDVLSDLDVNLVDAEWEAGSNSLEVRIGDDVVPDDIHRGRVFLVATASSFLNLARPRIPDLAINNRPVTFHVPHIMRGWRHPFDFCRPRPIGIFNPLWNVGWKGLKVSDRGKRWRPGLGWGFYWKWWYGRVLENEYRDAVKRSGKRNAWLRVVLKCTELER